VAGDPVLQSRNRHAAGVQRHIGHDHGIYEREAPREVGERALDDRDAKAAAHHDFARRERRPANTNAGYRRYPALRWDRDVDRLTGRNVDAIQPRSAAARERRRRRQPPCYGAQQRQGIVGHGGGRINAVSDPAPLLAPQLLRRDSRRPRLGQGEDTFLQHITQGRARRLLPGTSVVK